VRANVVEGVSGNFLGFSPEFTGGIIIVVVISMTWVAMAAAGMVIASLMIISIDARFLLFIVAHC
jgi:hypothetical protein